MTTFPNGRTMNVFRYAIVIDIFEGLKISYIRSLAVADYSMFVGNETDMTRLENLMSYLPNTPRSVQIATKIIEDSASLETDIMLLIDYFSRLHILNILHGVYNKMIHYSLNK